MSSGRAEEGPRGVVATSERSAAEAGGRMLAAGGNAVDAAVCAAACLTVTEPTSNGLGGDLFALVWDGARVHALDASGRAPAALDADRVRRLGFREMPLEGWMPVTVPGLVSGWGALLDRLGCLRLAEVLAPAIALGREGFPVGPITSAAWARAVVRFSRFAEWRRVFQPGGRTPAAGERFVNPDLSESLSVIAAGGADAFYRVLGPRIVDHATQTGGALTLEDLLSHRPAWVEPLRADFGPWQVMEAAPPTQGAVAAAALGMLDRLPATNQPGLTTHRSLEAIKLAFADAYAAVADPGSMPMSGRELVNRQRLERRCLQIDDDRAGPSPATAALPGGTVLVCAGDGEGRLVSLIQSNFWGFGSGIVVPGTGIALQNRGAGFCLEPGHPNELAGGKKPFHTLLPGLLLDRQTGTGMGAFGVMGGQMQPQGHVQLVSHLAGGLSPQAALDRPRWRWTDDGGVIFEEGFDPEVVEEVAARGHRVLGQGMEARHFGGGQVVLRSPDGELRAGSDRRKDGLVAWAERT